MRRPCCGGTNCLESVHVRASIRAAYNQRVFNDVMHEGGLTLFSGPDMDMKLLSTSLFSTPSGYSAEWLAMKR